MKPPNVPVTSIVKTSYIESSLCPRGMKAKNIQDKCFKDELLNIDIVAVWKLQLEQQIEE